MDYELVMLQLKDINIDHLYQRERLSKRVINEMFSNFDWNVFDPIDVNQRESGEYYAMDGLHRIETCKMKSFENIPSKLFKGLSIQQEADICNKKMNTRKKTTCAESFKSSLIAENPESLEIKNILETYNIHLSFIHNGGKRIRQRGYVSCFNVILRVYKNSISHFKRIFETLNTLYYIDGEWDSYAITQSMVSGIDYLLRYTDSEKLKISRLKQKCGGLNMPLHYTTLASANTVLLGRGSLPKQLARVMLEDYNLGLRSENKIDFKLSPGN